MKVSKKGTICFLFFWLLLLTIINNFRFFISIGGINIRYFYIPLVPLLWLVISKKKYNIKNIYNWWLIIIFTVIPYSFSLYNEIEMIDLIKNFVFLIVQLIIFFVVKNVYENVKEKITDYLYKVILIMSLLSLIIFVIMVFKTFGIRNETVFGIYYGHNGIPRLIGLFQDPNYYGLYLCSYYFLYKMLLIKNKLILKNYFLFILVFVNIFLTGSRAAFIIFIFGLFIFSILEKTLKIKTIIKLLSIIFTLLFIGFSFFPDYFETTISRFDFSKEKSAQERLELFYIGIGSVLNTPLGNGVGQSRHYYNKYHWRPMLPHNDFLTILVDGGIISLVLYLLLFLKIFVEGDKNSKFYLLIFMMYIFSLSCYSYEPIIPIILGILTAEIDGKKKEKLYEKSFVC